jgi:hypothetical protein
MTLDQIAVECGTDKASTGHNYTPIYERHLGHLRNESFSLLEVGVGGYEYPDRGGQSIRMWERYFPKAQIYCADVHEKKLNFDRATFIHAAQDSLHLWGLSATIIQPLVIIDDASHVNDLTIQTFKNLWPTVAPGGFYIIEDLHTAYWPDEYGGQNDLSTTHKSVMGFLFELQQDVNAEWTLPARNRQFPGIESITMYKSIAIIKKHG